VSGHIVEARDVTRLYRGPGGSTAGVFDATVTVDAGEIVGIRGPSGAGKSTLLRLLAGLDRPDHGEVSYNGSPAWPPLSRWRARRFAVRPRPGYVMPVYQDPFASLDARWPIWRTITEPLTVPSRSRLTTTDRRARARQLLEQSGMDHVDETCRPGELSGGQCQRVAILRAIIAQPALILADEPTARQDVITAAAMTRQLRDATEAGAALVVVSHNADWLDTFAHRILDLRDGCLLTPAPRAG
jgi:ABC-type glutathione transport system ATPase component